MIWYCPTCPDGTELQEEGDGSLWCPDGLHYPQQEDSDDDRP